MTRTADQPWEPGADADAHYALFRKERRVVADDGTPIAYSFRNPAGDGIPVLLANGWSCSDAYWGKLVPALVERGHPVLIPDTRGHGMSGLPRHPGRGARNLTIDDVSMARIGRDLLAVLDDAGVDRFVVVGHSMGTQTALELYRQVPQRVAAMALLAGTFENPAKTFYGQSIGDRLFPIGAAVMRWLPEVLSPIWMTIGPANVGHFGARMAKAAGPNCTAEDLHPYLLHLKSSDPAVMVLMAGAMRAHSAADLLPSITAPTLVVAAGADVFTPARCSEAMHHRIPGSELVTFPTAGHTLPVEEPTAIARALDDFLTRRVGARSAADLLAEPSPAAPRVRNEITSIPVEADTNAPSPPAVAPAARPPADDPTAPEGPTKSATAKKPVAKKATAKKATAKRSAAKGPVAKKAPAVNKATANKAPAKRAATKKAPAAKRAPARKAPAAKKVPGNKNPAQKTPAAEKATPNKASAKRSPAKKAPAKKAPAKTAPAKKAAAKKTSARKTPAAKKTAATKASGSGKTAAKSASITRKRSSTPPPTAG